MTEIDGTRLLAYQSSGGTTTAYCVEHPDDTASFTTVNMSDIKDTLAPWLMQHMTTYHLETGGNGYGGLA